MQYSQYNHLVSIPNSSNWILYNFLSGSLLELDESSKFVFDNILSIDGYMEERSLLQENGFIVKDPDEIAYIKMGNILSCTDKELLSVLIAPTMDCNLACPYCFESHRPGRMSPETQNEIIKFIEKLIVENHHKQIFVYWFGGEPLLGLEIIEKMSDRIIQIANQYGVKYTSSMSSNGYLLTPQIAEILEKCQVGKIQVTLDGMKEQNDKTRALKNGKGSFDQILNNLKELKANIEIQIRSNLSRDNWIDFPELKKTVEELSAQNGTKISIYAAQMEMYDNSDQKMKLSALSIEEYSDYLKTNNLIGTQKNHFSRFVFCDAGKLYSFCFDEQGNMYKCWNEVGKVKNSYGNVAEINRSLSNVNLGNALPYLSYSFPDDPECQKCKVLPLCMGGCIMRRVIEKNKSCSPVRFNMGDYILKKYSLMKGDEYSEAGH